MASRVLHENPGGHMATTNHHIQSAADHIIIARDFCGDERQALRDYEVDHGPFTRRERDAIRSLVEERWGESQAAAGVTSPILADERMAINQALEG